MKNKIIVLGHTGFIGKNIFIALKKKSYKNKNLIIKGISTQLIDLTKKISVKKLGKEITKQSIIIICVVFKPKSEDSLRLFNQKTLSRNQTMIKNITNVIKHKRPKKIIYLSSNAVYGVYKNHKLVDEEAKIVVDTFYGKSKYLFEEMLKFVIGEKERKKLIILRPTTVYGPNEKFISNNPSGFLKLAKNEKKISIWGNGNEVREFLYIDDLTKIIIKLIQKNFYGTLNLGGFSSSYINIINKVSKILKMRPKLENKKRTSFKVNKTYSKKLLKKVLPGIKLTSIEEGICKILRKKFA